jgi:hypothetical protein
MAAMIKTPERGLNDYIPDILLARSAALKGAE